MRRPRSSPALVLAAALAAGMTVSGLTGCTSTKSHVGGSDLMEVELWFDVPVGAKVTGLRVEGDQDAAGFLDNTPVAHAADGVLIAMTPRQL